MNSSAGSFCSFMEEKSEVESGENDGVDEKSPDGRYIRVQFLFLILLFLLFIFIYLVKLHRYLLHLKIFISLVCPLILIFELEMFLLNLIKIWH